MSQHPLCIYHAPCADGFTAAWAVGMGLNWEVDFHAGVHGQPPPDVTGRDVIIVDFSYKRPVLVEMAKAARTILILDHHASAERDLAEFPAPDGLGYNTAGLEGFVFALFDMNRSGAGLAWDFFNPGKPRPKLVDYVEDRDLWRFALPKSREIAAMLFSHDYDFAMWGAIADDMANPEFFKGFVDEGAAIERKHKKDLAELIANTRREMCIGGVVVPVANLPYTFASDAANEMAQGHPFAATYFDKPEGRVFSLRSTKDGADVSLIAAAYGGGGHKHAAGFQRPIGWEGDDNGVIEVQVQDSGTLMRVG